MSFLGSVSCSILYAQSLKSVADVRYFPTRLSLYIRRGCYDSPAPLNSIPSPTYSSLTQISAMLACTEERTDLNFIVLDGTVCHFQKHVRNRRRLVS